jgi:ABC-type uncharacterized transport system permease subunit
MLSAVSLVSFIAAVILYAGAAALFYLEVVRERQAEPYARVAPLAPGLLAGAAIAHGGYVVLASFVARVCPIYSIHFFLSLASLAATFVYLWSRRRYKLHALGLLVAPFGLVVAMGTYFLASAPYHKLPASFIGLHVLSNLIGDALFLLACGAAVLYLLQERQLKRKKPPRGGLPPLDSLDKAIHRFLVAGFPLLTLGVASGTVWAQKLEDGSTDELLRAAFGYATWLLIGGVLLLRVLAGWRGRRAAYGTIAGFACALTVLIIYIMRPILQGAERLGG